MVIPFNIGKVGKFFSIPARDIEYRFSAGNRGVKLLVGFDGNGGILRGELTDNLVKQFRFQGDFSFFQNQALNLSLNAHFHVVGSKFDLIGGGVDEDAL